jgi:hypothetical protein
MQTCLEEKRADIKIRICPALHSPYDVPNVAFSQCIASDDPRLAK